MTECPACGKSFESIGTHWRYNNHRPDFTPYQHDVIIGLLMGDGSINRGDKNPYLQVEMITEPYMKYLCEIFDKLGRGYSISKESNGNHKKKFQFTTRNNPNLKEYSDWYSTGKKVWPSDIHLTPTVLTHWYVGDGHFNESNATPFIEISMANEIDNRDKVCDMFRRVDLPEPTFNYSSARWSVNESKELFEYMNDPLPGFEYKFPSQK
ncbi:homing endonuclease with LAGLIDADG motif [Halogranum tailed virus 1]|uniref:LAGLIDADG endonuclease n=1 Tax=Halogranum tailed virus 1 TaxID=1273749 RepID=R4TLE1_9CAUD|nr:homing endonuclease with LAGLIDADG motif [Halogranum tailed virus 1]AGM11502.1 LAGLIDADG endonuclease [Halogranum tailed virus 1]